MKKKVLYISNIEVPYRVRFFNELAKHCDLTVLYEMKRSTNRNAQWAYSEKQLCRNKYLKGIKLAPEEAFSFGIVKEVLSGYDAIIVGCYNSVAQALAIVTMRLFKVPYILNLDGDPAMEGSSFKSRMKRFVLRGATGYIAAGEKTAQIIKPVTGESPVTVYHFSSLSEQEVEDNSQKAPGQRSEDVLAVSQYFERKGMDVVLEAARNDPGHHYKLVGMGHRTELFLQEFEGKIPDNVEIIPFLQKPELEKEYQKCGIMVLPSRRDCWGLVINEAASFGAPIVSTRGSGAAVEFLEDDYPQLLAKPGDAEDLLRCIRQCRALEDKEAYVRFLLEKSRCYTIEENVQAHLTALGISVEA